MHFIDLIFVRAQNAWFSARDEETGQTLVEYALIIAVIGIGSLVALGFLSGKITNLFNKTGNVLNNAT